MFCKLCGEHLYKDITFYNLFKLDYYIHKKCEKTLNKSSDYITYPLFDKLVFQDYLFEEKYGESDHDFLFQKYGYLFYEKMMKNHIWSIVIFVDEVIQYDTMILIAKLADKGILFCSVFNENFL